MIRILLVDDQNLVQQGIKSLLAQDPDLEIVGTLKDGRSAVSKVAELSPDIVLLDIEMPEMDGITATKYITRLAPQTKVIILSSHEDKKYLTQALMAGARGYLLKDSLVRDLRQSIIAVNNGYTQMESRLLAKVFHPSNLKSNSRQKTNHQEQRLGRSPNPTAKTAVKTTAQAAMQGTVVQQTTSSRKQSMAFADPAKDNNGGSDTVTLNQSPRDEHDVIETAYLKPISTVPKINLPHSELEHFETVPMESSRELVEMKEITVNQTLPAIAVKSSALKLSTTKQFLILPAKSKKYKYSQLIARYQALLAQAWASQKLRHQPLINRCQSQMAQYKYQLSPLLRQLQKKGWLTNAGLALLGLIIVIIISQMFS
jgi:DNA-binding NarL/FixJ family response regulator